MAIHQHPRENLLLEATAYTRRCLYRVQRSQSWTAGCEKVAEQPVAQETSWQHDTEPDRLFCKWLGPFQPHAEWEMFIGLRADQRWSIYFDEQPVLQFNRHHQLRRLFADGQRYAAHNGKLQRLERSQLGGKVRLQQVKLDEASHAAVLDACQRFLEEAVQALRSGRARRIGQFPENDTAWLPAFERNLQLAAHALTVAASPAQ